MSESLSYTPYQQGTYLHHALKEGANRRTFQVILHYAVPIVEDESETWMGAYPPELWISRELAQHAVEQTKIMDERNASALQEKKLLSERTTFLNEAARRAASAANDQRLFVFGIKAILGRYPSINDLDNLFNLGEPLQTDDLKQLLRAAIESVVINTNPVQDSWPSAETITQGNSEMPQGPVQSTAAEKDARERAEFSGYRSLIERIERDHRNRNR